MKKSELIEKVSKSASMATNKEISKKAVDTVLSDTLKLIAKTVKKDGRFSYPGFGTFSLTSRKARKGRNPQTGESIKIKASKSIKFKPAPGIKNSL